jgi:rSAM/selenodomain-associated transferase 1
VHPDPDKINRILIIFVKNPVLGQVKTRLAATVGEERALEVYRQLLARTRTVTEGLARGKAVFYADFIPESDAWDEAVYQKHLQEGSDLGERMERAFAWAFSAGYTSVCIIGSDCFQLTEQVLEQGFSALAEHEVVLGPSTDGGYYLLGMNRLHPAFFRSKRWSTDTVLADTVRDAEALGLRVKLLPTLTDVDEEKDLGTLSEEKGLAGKGAARP